MRKRVQKREDGIWFRRSQKTVSILFRAELTARARQTRTPPEGNRTVRVFTFAGLAKEISKPKGGGTPLFDFSNSRAPGRWARLRSQSQADSFVFAGEVYHLIGLHQHCPYNPKAGLFCTQI